MAFHWKDNWFFERLEDGSVRIYHKDLEADQEDDIVEYDVCLDIDADSWASIMASVSARGENAETFREAKEFHMETVEEGIHECEVCGHKGSDVEWQETIKPGYYCRDQADCFLRYQEQRDEESERATDYFREQGSNY